MSTPELDVNAAVPGVTHRLSEDGLMLTSTYDAEDAHIEAKVGWLDEQRAQANYLNAMRAFERRLPDLIEKARDPQQNSRSRLRRFRLVDVVAHRGPPTWWLPNFGVETGEVRLGWLRVAVQIRRRRSSR